METNKNLVWKYFLEQKGIEICGFFALIIFIFFIGYGLPIAIGLNIGDNQSSWCVENECGYGDAWLEGVLWLVGIGFGGYIISLWFKSNWEDAIEKVEEEIQEQKRKRRKKR